MIALLLVIAAVPQEPVALRGTVVVRDRDGELHERESGTVCLAIADPGCQDEGDWLEVELHDGQWETRVTEGALVTVGYVSSGPEPLLVVQPRCQQPLPDSRTLDVLAAAEQALCFRVYEARSGEELDGVTVLECWGEACGGGHPGPEGARSATDVGIRDAPSPVQVPPCSGVGIRSLRVHWVGAPGFAWQVVHSDPARGGTISVPLQREAGLRPPGDVRAPPRVPRGRRHRSRRAAGPAGPRSPRRACAGPRAELARRARRRYDARRGPGRRSRAMERQEYIPLADACLARVVTWLEEFDPDELDFSEADGVVTLEFADGARFVLNRQSAASQMWFAAGARAWHYGWDAGQETWVCDRDGHELFEKISAVVSEKLGRAVAV